jgi:hypothetical protein
MSNIFYARAEELQIGDDKEQKLLCTEAGGAIRAETAGVSKIKAAKKCFVIEQLRHQSRKAKCSCPYGRPFRG